jgi:hypothetical protein
MGSTLNNLQVMETRCNHERSSIAHLRELPPGMFDLVVKRIAKGDPLTQIAKSLHTIQPDFAEETFRKWLHDLAKQVRQLLTEETNIDDVAKTIEDRSAANTEAEPPALGRPPGPAAGGAKRLKATVKQACEDITAEMMLKYLWANEQKRFDKMMDLETRMGVVSPALHKEIDTMRGIAEALAKLEMGTAMMKRKWGVIPDPRPMEPPEPGSLAEQFSKFDILDRNLVRTAATHVIDMIRDRAKWQAEENRKTEVDNPENGPSTSGCIDDVKPETLFSV